MKDFWNYIFIGTTIISSAGLIFVIYSRSVINITSRLFILTLILVIAYLISHTVHFIIMPAHDLTLLDRSCHSLLLMILLSLTFLALNYPAPQKISIIGAMLLVIPSAIILLLLWKGLLISESFVHGFHFSASFTPYYTFYIYWYLALIIISIISILIKYRKSVDAVIKKQLLLFLFGLIITNTTTFVSGILLPWIQGFYYLVEISPLAFLAGLIFFTSIAIGKYNMFPAALEKVYSFSLNKKIFFSALIVIPVIILLIQIPIGRVIFNIHSQEEVLRFFMYSIFIGIIVSLVLSFIVSKIIAHPIILLKEKVLEIKKGNYKVNINIKSADEIGELASAINNMALTLNKNQIDLSKKEERISVLLNAFEKSFAAIAVTDNDFNIVEANSQFYSISGLLNNQIALQRIDVIQFQNNSDLLSNILKEVNKKGVYTGEIKITGLDNKQKELLISVSKIISSNDIQKGYLFVEIDITDKKKLEAEIAKSEKLAALGKMSAILAHEIKTPLTSIKMNVDILSQSLKLNEDDKESFEIIKKETNRLTELVKEVLQFSRTSELVFSKVNLRELIDEIIQIAELNCRNKQIKFFNNSDNIEIKADADKIKQVFLNLIQNSIEAIDNQGLIEITSETKAPYIFIYIKDNGKGIEDTERIFEPFFTTKASGTGLGLSVSQKIIEQHNGTLSLVSSKKGETIFEVKIPLSI